MSVLALLRRLRVQWLGLDRPEPRVARDREARSRGPSTSSSAGGRFLLTTLLAGVLFVLTIGAATLLSLIVIPIAVAFLGRGGPGMILAFAVGIAIACVLVSYLSARLSQFHYMIIDQNAGVIDSLALSWEATRGRVGTLIVVYAFLVLICLAGLLACLVGILFTAPFAYLMLAVTYLSLTEQPLGLMKPEIEYWDEDGL